MKKFIHKIITLIITIVATYLLLGLLADGYTDPFYLRITSPKQKSLILGTSRAAQGIRPSIMDSILDNKTFNIPIYNFSFTILHSPYGETYYKAIEAKLDKNNLKGLFVLAVDPWSISLRTNLQYDVESKKELSKITYFNMNPNYDYLKNAYKKSFFHLLNNKISPDKSMLLHEDGWLEVTINMDKQELKRRTVSKIKTYKENSKINRISSKRINWLEKTIFLLEKHGKVVLVRIPVNNEILNIEKKAYKNFDSIIRTKFSATPYLNYKDMSGEYSYIDGNHLHKESGKKFSVKLAKDINLLFLND